MHDSPDDPPSIGAATMETDGTVVLTLRAEGPGTLGDATLRYPPDHPRYRAIRDHIGNIAPGEEKPVPPWPAELYRTTRLVVRHLTPDDYDALYATYSDPDAMKWVDDGLPITPEDCRRWLDITLRNYATRGYGMSAIAHVDAPADVIGFIGLVHPGGQPEAELKYALRRAFWGQGLATEAARGMLAHGRAAHGLERVIATIDPDNRASDRVLRKIGFDYVTQRIDDGEPVDVYAITLG